jgi:hypothetical protein
MILLKTKNLFRKIIIIQLISLIPIWILSLFSIYNGQYPFELNGKNISGLTGMLISIPYFMFVAVMLSAFFWIQWKICYLLLLLCIKIFKNSKSRG